MARIGDILKRARQDGAVYGSNAATWYWDMADADTGLSDYRKVLKGIRDGDPEIMDTFTYADLSGQHADAPTPQSLYEELDMNDKQIERYGEKVCQLWEDSFNTAYQESVEQSCIDSMRRNVIFHINVAITEQDEDKLLSDLEELLAKQNCELTYSEHEEDN